MSSPRTPLSANSILVKGLALPAGLALFLVAAPLQAQTLELPASKALECLTPQGADRGVPAYPVDEFGRQSPGKVTVELAFDDPRSGPRIRVQESQGPYELERAVKAHVAAYRVPCLAQIGGRAVLRFEFVFTPERRRAIPLLPKDVLQERDREMLRCRVSPPGEETPRYPRAALSENLQGRVFARLRFTSPEAAPEVQTFSAGRIALDLERAVRLWAEKQRLPCLSGEPVDAEFKMLFRIDGMGSYGMKDMSLRSFLTAVKGIDRQRLVLDLDTMSCPFDVQVDYLRPRLPNKVAELDTHDPARRPLLEWLAGAELDLTPVQLQAAFASRFTVVVPCGSIRVEPKP